MKAKLFSIVLMAIASISASYTFAQEKKFSKSKSYSKSYSISGSDKINLENQFGEMKLITWDKNEVKVDVSITGTSDEEARAQKIIDRISIEDGKTSGSVSFKTKFANQEKDWNDKNNKHTNEGMKVNYTVYLPSGNPLNAKNQFGATIIPDYRGEATLESQFGSLTTGKITNAKKINVQFGKADIEQVNGGALDIRYTSATVNKLTGDVDANLQFSTVKMNIDNGVKTLDVSSSYTDVYLDLNKNVSASYKISTSYGGFKNQSNFTMDGTEKGFNEKTYTGKSGSGDAKINVSSSFGSVVAGHDLKVDMTKKKKGSTATN